jgi:flagellar hook protein FlgE
MGMKNTFIITSIIAAVLLSGLAAAIEYEFNSRVVPHTEYNPLREGCYYYYGYGSCKVADDNCVNIPQGMVMHEINLGDACKRNKPPKLVFESVNDIKVTETETVRIGAQCIDKDPVNITYSGWTTTKETKTGYDDAGSYKETITCTDSFGEKDEATINIRIINKNRAPVFRALGFDIIRKQ